MTLPVSCRASCCDAKSGKGQFRWGTAEYIVSCSVVWNCAMQCDAQQSIDMWFRSGTKSPLHLGDHTNWIGAFFFFAPNKAVNWSYFCWPVRCSLLFSSDAGRFIQCQIELSVVFPVSKVVSKLFFFGFSGCSLISLKPVSFSISPTGNFEPACASPGTTPRNKSVSTGSITHFYEKS